MTRPLVEVHHDIGALAEAAARDFLAIGRDAIAARGVFTVALSGGSTPKYMFAELVARGRDALAWDAVDFWWGDERTVPPDHPDSNYGMAAKLLLEPLGIARSHIHRMEGERDPVAAARDYEAQLCASLGMPPVFDFNLLGMGKDGHTASLFPGSPGLAEQTRFVIANPVDSPLTGGATTRITLTFPAIAASRHTRVLVAGTDKAPALAGVLDGPKGQYPSQLITGADVRWVVDADAAAQLRSHV
jgi:6-phosphogluconolactonase